MAAKNCPNDAQALEFDGYVAHWKRVLNLADWRIERMAGVAKGAMADVGLNPAARLAGYRLGDFGPMPITSKTLSLTALHELLHVFLHDLIVTAQDRNAAEDALEREEHRVINVLEGVIGERSGGPDLL